MGGRTEGLVRTVALIQIWIPNPGIVWIRNWNDFFSIHICWSGCTQGQGVTHRDVERVAQWRVRRDAVMGARRVACTDILRATALQQLEHDLRPW